MRNKNNLVLYVDKDLVEKSKELGFNLSKTFENHLKHLMTQFSIDNSLNNFDSAIKNDKKWAEPDLNRRPLARKAKVLFNALTKKNLVSNIFQSSTNNLILDRPATKSYVSIGGRVYIAIS